MKRGENGTLDADTCAATPKSAAPEAVWRVCHVLTADCKRCPPTEDMPPHGLCVRGCYMLAEECINTVETGNPWRKTGKVRAPFIAVVAPLEASPRQASPPIRDAVNPSLKEV